ncbi:recombinase zinc beta ribbon domain-containing protein [uncultured Phascolarctobacterium sp.]|uniref:recombinase zinc beta ribbon domain-containing protein n=1 Tax=uncultured Phascolarctobacterium sp. TaxID=512296 RepID=UPI003452BC7F
MPRPPNSTKLGFRQDNLYRLLKNPIVIGKFVWADIILNDYEHCRIISDELFEAVQLRLNSRKRRGNVNMIEYALSGKIFCGKCGAPMFGVYGTSGTNKQKYYYYKCSNTLKGKHDCDMPAINRNALEQALYENIVALLNEPKTLSTIAQEALSIINSGEDIELLTMRKRLLQLKPEAEKAVDMYLNCDDGKMRDAITKRYRALTDEIEALEVEVAKRSINVENRHITEDMIISFLKKMSKESKRKLLQTMVQKVVINENNGDDSYTVTVALNYTPTATTSNKIDINFNKIACNSSNRYELVGPVGFEPTTSRL